MTFASSAFQNSGFQTDSVAPTPPAVGSVGVRGRGSRVEYHYVVIDGVEYRVGSVEEAREILLRLRELAAKRAKRNARRAVVKSADPALEPIKAEFRSDDRSSPLAQQIQAQVDAANARTAKHYARSLQAALDWRKKRARPDDEDDDIAFLLGIM